MRLSFFIILLINIFLSVGCTPKGKSPVPKILLADIDVVRSLKTGELADNRKIQNDYNLKLKLLKKITVLDVSEGGELVGITHQGNCLFSQFQIARRINNSDSYKNFLASCNNKSNYYHKLAVKRLSALRKLKAEEQKPEPPPVKPQSQTVKSCSDAVYYKASGSKTALKIFLSNCGDMGHYNYKKAYSLLTPKLVFRPKPEPKPDPPKPEPEPPPVKPQSQTVKSCSDADYYEASGSKTALKIFLSKCGDMGHYNYKKAYSLLNPKLVFRPKPEPKVVLPKVTASPPKVAKQAEKPQAIIIPTGSLGEMSKIRIKILEKTLESELGNYFSIVPKELFEEAKEKAFEELDYGECTEDQCILKIQELLQVENAFKMELISEDGDTQISITWNDQDQKRVVEDYCEGCKTKELRKMIGGLLEKLVKGKN